MRRCVISSWRVQVSEKGDPSPFGACANRHSEHFSRLSIFEPCKLATKTPAFFASDTLPCDDCFWVLPRSLDNPSRTPRSADKSFDSPLTEAKSTVRDRGSRADAIILSRQRVHRKSKLPSRFAGLGRHSHALAQPKPRQGFITFSLPWRGRRVQMRSQIHYDQMQKSDRLHSTRQGRQRMRNAVQSPTRFVDPTTYAARRTGMIATPSSGWHVYPFKGTTGPARTACRPLPIPLYSPCEALWTLGNT